MAYAARPVVVALVLSLWGVEQVPMVGLGIRVVGHRTTHPMEIDCHDSDPPMEGCTTSVRGDMLNAGKSRR